MMAKATTLKVGGERRARRKTRTIAKHSPADARYRCRGAKYVRKRGPVAMTCQPLQHKMPASCGSGLTPRLWLRHTANAKDTHTTTARPNWTGTHGCVEKP